MRACLTGTSLAVPCGEVEVPVNQAVAPAIPSCKMGLMRGIWVTHVKRPQVPAADVACSSVDQARVKMCLEAEVSTESKVAAFSSDVPWGRLCQACLRPQRYTVAGAIAGQAHTLHQCARSSYAPHVLAGQAVWLAPFSRRWH